MKLRLTQPIHVPIFYHAILSTRGFPIAKSITGRPILADASPPLSSRQVKKQCRGVNIIRMATINASDLAIFFITTIQSPGKFSRLKLGRMLLWYRSTSSFESRTPPKRHFGGILLDLWKSLLSAFKQDGSKSQHRRPFRDGIFKVATHPHRKMFQVSRRTKLVLQFVSQSPNGREVFSRSLVS
jgi:hypothetical protein